ncbi:MAG: hypothetical protein JW795_16405 [Chitinivibrionales bacterium]|nr:hypothetical protein [Chitinivibrionales bacterium]
MKWVREIAGISACIILFQMVTNGQSVEAFTPTVTEKKLIAGTTFLDPSKFSIHHSISFGMSTSGSSHGLQSQSLYTTMLTYQFSAPITVNVNIGLPLYSSYQGGFNLNKSTLQSAEYFKNIPLDATLTWQPSSHFSMQINVIRNSSVTDYHSFSPFFPLRHTTEPEAK